MAPTHLVGAAAVAVCVAAFGPAQFGIVQTGVLAAGALAADRIPDQDRRFDTSEDHRSVTHSVVLAGGLALLVAWWTVGAFGFSTSGLGTLGDNPKPLLGTFAGGGAAGYLTHLALDSMTPKRVWLLLPGGPKFGLVLIGRTGGFGEWLVFFGLAGLFGATLALHAGLIPPGFVAGTNP